MSPDLSTLFIYAVKISLRTFGGLNNELVNYLLLLGDDGEVLNIFNRLFNHHLVNPLISSCHLVKHIEFFLELIRRIDPAVFRVF